LLPKRTHGRKHVSCRLLGIPRCWISDIRDCRSQGGQLAQQVESFACQLAGKGA
jgi:hypothetical protein